MTQRDVAQLVDVHTAIRVVREACVSMARGRACMPAKVYLPLPGGNDFRAMPAYLGAPACCGVKWVNVHPQNPRRGLPTVMAVVVLNDPATGVPLAVMDGLLITKLRTAAAGAVAAQALARPESRVIGLIGCGAQADTQLLALAELFRLQVVKVWGYRPGEAAQFCRSVRRRLPGVHLVAEMSIEACVRDSDVLVTITPSHRPLVKRAWVNAGTHINAIGADAPGKQELDPAILRRALVVVDQREQAIHGGELNVPVASGAFDPRRIHATLGDVLIGRRRARRDGQEVTVFDSTGLAIHDVALAHAIAARAAKRRIGRTIPLVVAY